MMNIFISAYLVNNLGDDMFVTLLCRHFPEINFYLSCEKNFSLTFKKVENLTILPPGKYDAHFLESFIDYQVLIGGSLFMEPQNKEEIKTKYKSVISYRISKRIPFFIIGANFGPFKSIQHLELYRQWFKEIDSISFRDFKSYQLFKDQKNVRWYPDLLFSYDLPELIKSQNTITIVPIYNNHRIGLPEYSNEDYFNFCANVSVKYIEKGFDITLASFCIHQQDSLAIDKICSIIPKEYRDRVSVIEYVNDIDSFLKKFLSSKFIIGTRFHSIILAWKANIPVFPIVYNSKTSNVIQDYGYSGNYADIRHLESVSFDMLEENRNGPIFQCKKLIEKSHMHLYFLNQALHRHNKWEV